MKLIDTSAVNANKWLPLLGNYLGSGNTFVNNSSTSTSMAGIDFIQQAYSECLDAIAQLAVTNPLEITVMWGCNKFYTPPAYSIFDAYYEPIYTLSSPYSYGVNPGFIYYLGELYYVPGMAYTVMTGSNFINATISTAYSTADAAAFSDSASHNIHMIRTIAFSVSTTPHTSSYDSGIGIPDYNNWKFASDNSSSVPIANAVIDNWTTNTWGSFLTAYTTLTTPAITVVNTTGNPQFENGWTNTGLSGTNPLSYYKVLHRVCLWGEVTLTVSSNPPYLTPSTIFHLPQGFRPLSTEELFAVPDITAANYTSGGTNVGATYYIWVQSDGSVTFLCKTTQLTGTVKISLSGINFLAGVYTPPAQILAPVSNQSYNISL